MTMKRPIPSDFLRENKEWLITWTTIIVTALLVTHFWPQPPSPVPAYMKEQANFAIIYPKGLTVDPKSWNYLRDEKSVQFTVKKGSANVVLTEQKTPLAYQTDVAAYNRFIGGLRPRANFDVPLGTVSITNFVTSGDYQVVGETGILNAKGTMLLAHPDRQMSDDDWQSFFQELQVD